MRKSVEYIGAASEFTGKATVLSGQCYTDPLRSRRTRHYAGAIAHHYDAAAR